MKRFFTLVLGALAMVAVALVSAFIAMRLAIHGREVEVPNLSGLTVAEASELALRDGLSLNLENRFYSGSVAAGHILAQYPSPGSRVRRESELRVTESSGAQRVSIPDLTGESERAATIGIRRLSLDLGVVAHLAVPGDADIVLTQTPPANSGGVDGPRVSLLVSDPEDSEPPPAYVMPSLLGLTFASASAQAAAAGLHLIATPDTAQPAAQTTAQTTAQPTPQPTASPDAASTLATPAASPSSPAPAQSAANPSAMPVRPTGVVTAQSPLPGRRVVQGDAVHVVFGHPTPASPSTPSQ